MTFMKIIPQNNVPEFSLPLPIFSSIHLADAIGRDGEEFSVFVGLVKKYAEQLKALALDESDVDLLVDFLPEQKSYRNFLNVADLAEKLLDRKVEVLTPQSLSPYLAPYIEKDVVYVQTT